MQDFIREFLSRIVLLPLWCLVVVCGNAQNQAVADSLKTILGSEDYAGLPDSAKFELLNDLAYNESNTNDRIKYADILISSINNDAVREYLIWKEKGYFQKGTAYRLRGDFDEAFDNYFNALEIAETISYEEGISTVLMGIADTYSEIGNSDESLKHYNLAIAKFRIGGDSIKLGSTLYNAGDEYLKSNELDQALNYFLESSLIFNQLNYVLGRAYNLGNIGLVYAKQGKMELAEANLREAMALCTSLENYYGISAFQHEMARVYVDNGQLEQALNYARSSLDVALEHNYRELIKDATYSLSQIYQGMGQEESAYDFLKTHLIYRDSLNRESVLQEMADVRREFEVSQKQLEVDLLNEQKRNQQIIGAGLIIILLMAVGFLVMVYRNYQRKNRLSNELEQLNQTKDKFFSIISHDLRGPISAFNGISRMIRMYIIKERFQDLESMTHDIDDSVASIASLLDNLLNWAAQQQGHLPYNPERIQVNEMVGNIFQTFKATADAKNIQLSADIPETLSVWADRNSAVTILRNLTSNALKFTPEGGSVSIEASEADRFALIKVKDSGVGMNQEKLDDLFKLKDQKSTYGTSGEKGIGLGLQLVNEFTQLNKGKVEVESEEGKGTTFTISLPLARRVKEVLIEDE